MKRCARCAAQKPADQFRQWPDRKRGFKIRTDSYCFPCRSEVNVESYKRQRETFAMLNTMVRGGNRRLAMALRKELVKRG